MKVIRACSGSADGRDWNRVKLQALLTLMAHTEDSNILSRQNPAVLRAVQEEMIEFLRCGGAYREDAIKLLEDMDADYSRRGISAGGCADLLAAAIFILELTEGGTCLSAEARLPVVGVGTYL